MTDAEKNEYATIKSKYPHAVLLMKIATGQWAARWVDMDHVLTIHPRATMNKDYVLVSDAILDRVVAGLKAAGQFVALVEKIAKAPKGAQAEYFQDNLLQMVQPA